MFFNLWFWTPVSKLFTTKNIVFNIEFDFNYKYSLHSLSCTGRLISFILLFLSDNPLASFTSLLKKD